MYGVCGCGIDDQGVIFGLFSCLDLFVVVEVCQNFIVLDHQRFLCALSTAFKCLD